MRLRLLLLLLPGVLLIGCSGQKSTSELVTDLKSSNEHDRVVAVRLLENRKGDPDQVIPALIEALKDKEADVRWGAANGLGYYGEQARAAIPALQATQHDSDARVRHAADVALSRIDPTLAPKGTARKRGS